jgi:hypothetical protein
MMGEENYGKTAPQLAKGKSVKFKGRLALESSKGDKVVVGLAEVYSGNEPAVRAVDLVKDFTSDRAKAVKKYDPKGNDLPPIIVEGTVSELQPDHYTVVLFGDK